MGLRTTAESEQERRQIDAEWERERAYPLANLSTARRSGLTFVKAQKSDDEWAAHARTLPSAKQQQQQNDDVAKSHADFYKNLVRSGSGTPHRSQSPPALSIPPAQVAATASHLAMKRQHRGLDLKQVVGHGSKEEPYLLEDDESADENHSINETVESAREVSTRKGRQNDYIAQSADVDTSTSYSAPTLGAQPSQDDSRESTADPPPDNGDMYCLLCETLVPADDVQKHPTSILHNLSRSQKGSSSKVIQPLVPPTYYALKSNNVGYAMMKRLGWKEESALGRSATNSSDEGSSNGARKTPIRVIEKFDRKGVGVDSKRKYEELEREGKIVKVPREGEAGKKVARPLAKNLKEMERDRKRDMEFFKAGLAYLNN